MHGFCTLFLFSSAQFIVLSAVSKLLPPTSNVPYTLSQLLAMGWVSCELDNLVMDSCKTMWVGDNGDESLYCQINDQVFNSEIRESVRD